MNEIIQALEADVTNGKENFYMISENKLLALKELSKREEMDYKKLEAKIDKAIKLCNIVLENEPLQSKPDYDLIDQVACIKSELEK